jgi:hypothetical protein
VIETETVRVDDREYQLDPLDVEMLGDLARRLEKVSGVNQDEKDYMRVPRQTWDIFRSQLEEFQVLLDAFRTAWGDPELQGAGYILIEQQKRSIKYMLKENFELDY